MLCDTCYYCLLFYLVCFVYIFNKKTELESPILNNTVIDTDAGDSPYY